MLGLAILFGLAVWCVVTLIAMGIGYKIGKKKGMITGFMLTMGGWFVWWAVEFAYIQARVSYLCHKEAGITVYVTPEQWRKQIGEEEWGKMRAYDDKERETHHEEDIELEGQSFSRIAQINQNVVKYADWEKLNEFIGKKTVLLIDERSRQVLVKFVSFAAGAGNWIASGGSPKFWINSVSDCSHLADFEPVERTAAGYSNPALKHSE